MTTNAGAGGTEQGNSGIPPVESEDLNPPKGSTTTEAPDNKTDSPKTGEKQATESQPSDEKNEGAKEKGPGPWDAEMQKRGIADPKFDSFLREVVQPYVTQLEQGSGEGGGEIHSLFEGDMQTAEAAKELLMSFVEDPETAYRDLGEALNLSPGVPEGEGGADELGYSDDDLGNEPEQSDERLSYVEQLMQREQEAQEDAEYEAVLKSVGERVGEGFDDELFTDFVLASGGNIDRALQRYMQYHRTPEAAPTAPPVNGQGNTPPPEAPKFNSIDDALDAVLAEDRAKRQK
ncbi:MAG: hypothetical protein OJJ55_19110 [Rhodococcus sp.]|nr:hypothetical protein [Rhodococcus sp. (in: high G+C Gram-positive bacteria)]